MTPTSEQIVAALDAYDESLSEQERPTSGARIIAMQAALDSANSHIAMQTKGEPVTDEGIDLIARPFSTYNVASGSREFDHQGFARALLSASINAATDAAAPTMQAAVEPLTDMYRERSTVAGFIEKYGFCHWQAQEVIFQRNVEDHARLFAIPPTSKADTSKIRNAALEEAAAECDLSAKNYGRSARGGDNSGVSDHMENAAQILAEEIRSLKSQ